MECMFHGLERTIYRDKAVAFTAGINIFYCIYITFFFTELSYLPSLGHDFPVICNFALWNVRMLYLLT